jgi:hypothetical protein
LGQPVVLVSSDSIITYMLAYGHMRQSHNTLQSNQADDVPSLPKMVQVFQNVVDPSMSHSPPYQID